MNENFVLAIDLGSYTIKAGIGYLSENGNPSMLTAVEVPSAGIIGGMIVDAPKVVESITSVIEKLHQSSDVENFEYMPVVVAISGKGIFASKSSKGTITLRENVAIDEKDISKAIEQAKISAPVPSEHEIIYVHPNRFSVDKFEHVINPIGMHGKRLYVEAYIVSMDKSALRNVRSVLSKAGIYEAELLFSPIADGYSIYYTDEIGAYIVLNLGEDLTSISLWDRNSLEFVNVYEFGVSNVVSELASDLSITKTSARQLLSSISIYVDYFSTYEDEQIEIYDEKLSYKKKVSKSRAITVASDVMGNIFSSILREVESTNFLRRFGTTNVFLVGGGANISGIDRFAEEQLRLPVVVGYPNINVNDEAFRNPKFSVVSGMIRMFFESPNARFKYRSRSKKNWLDVIRNKLKEMFG